MHDLVEVTGDVMRLRYRPEDLVVLPDTFVPDPSQPPMPTEPQPGEPPEPLTTATPPTPPAPSPPSALGSDALRIIAALVNPVGEDSGLETVTHINRSAVAVSLDGWEIRDRQVQAAAKAGFRLAGTLAAGETLRVALGRPVQLGNNGDDLVLVDSDGLAVQSVTFKRGEAAKLGGTLLF